MARITTPVATLSYPALFEARAMEAGQDPKYSACLVFKKGDPGLLPLEKAADEAGMAKWGDKWLAGKKSGKFKWPIREDLEGKYGEPGEHVFINARSKEAPIVVDQQVKPITDKKAIYPGCKVKATLGAFPYDQTANKGVSFGLGNVQKVAEGSRIDGRRNPEDEFEVLPPEDLALAEALL